MSPSSQPAGTCRCPPRGSACPQPVPERSLDQGNLRRRLLEMWGNRLVSVQEPWGPEECQPLGPGRSGRSQEQAGGACRVTAGRGPRGTAGCPALPPSLSQAQFHSTALQPGGNWSPPFFLATDESEGGKQQPSNDIGQGVCGKGSLPGGFSALLLIEARGGEGSNALRAGAVTWAAGCPPAARRKQSPRLPPGVWGQEQALRPYWEKAKGYTSG